ncbi:MAG: response regulator transcription factor [Syntrophales bacterium]
MATEEETRTLSKGEVNQLLETWYPEGAAERIKILIVEDDQATKLLYNRGLFEQVFDRKVTPSGREALRLYAEWHPDIIVLDIFLPEITGYQVLKEIRTILDDRKTVIVMATSLSGRDDVLSCIKLGADGYITKPFSCGEIGTKILSYYAKREPDRAKKAAALCAVIAKQSRLQSLLEKDSARPKEDPQEAAEVPADDRAAGKE